MYKKSKYYFSLFRKSLFFNLFCYLLISSFTWVLPPYKLTFFSWIAPFGFFLLIEKYKTQYKKLFWNGILAGIIFQLFAFNWLINLSMTFGGMNYFFAVVTTILSGVFLNLKFSLFLVLFAYLKCKFPNFKIILAGICILICELFLFQIFAWYFGYMLTHIEIFAQTAEFFSIYGLSFLLFCVSYSLFRISQFPQIFRKKKVLLKVIKTPLFFLLIFSALGFYAKNKWEKVEIIKTKNILIIQPDPPLEFRDNREFEISFKNLILTIKNLSKETTAGKKIDIVFLGESAVPFFSANPTKANIQSKIYWEEFENTIKEIAQRYDANVFFNEINAVFSKNQEILFLNNNSLYDANSKRRDSYQKVKLLIFGEYMPFEFLYKIIPQTGRFEKGKKHSFISYFKREKNELIEEGKILPLICYEIIFPEFLRNFQNLEKADFIANLTNDKWYGNSLEPYQHLELSRIRAIETRKPIVRVTNSGISAVIDHFGKVQKQTGIMTQTTLTSTIKIPKPNKTFYNSFGNFPIYSFIILFFTLILFLEREQKYAKRKV